MARSFASASSMSLSNANAVISGSPCTRAAWFTPNQTNANCAICAVDNGNSGSIDEFILYINNSASVTARATVAGSPQNANTTTTYSASVWQHATGVFTSATSR